MNANKEQFGLKPFPRIFLIFLAVDWPLFMRRPMIVALAESAMKFGVTIVAVNRPLCPLSTFLRKPHRRKELFSKPHLEKLTDNLYLFSPKYFIHDFVANRIRILELLNRLALKRSYRYLTDQINIDEPNPLTWYYYPQQAYVTKLFPDSFSIYEIYDNLTDLQGHEDKYMTRLEKKYRKQVNLALTTSQDIHNRYGVNYPNSIIFGNGISREIFQKLSDENLTPSSDILKIKSPRIGYAGMVSERLDWKLISQLAKAKPEWSFIFAGKINDKRLRAIQEDYPNIHFTGTYIHSQVPSILKAFDIGILPYQDNEFFWHFRPLKFFEYAAAGLPTVTARSDQLKEFSADFVKVIPSQAEKWIEAINTQLKADRVTARKMGTEIASRFIWEDMTNDLLEKIRCFL